MFIVRVTGRISTYLHTARMLGTGQRVWFGRNRTFQSAVKRCSVQILCRCWVFLPVADASNGWTRWRVTGGGVLEVIVLIAGAWRLDWDLGRDIKGGGVCCDVKGSRNAGYWYGRYDTDQAQGVAGVAVSTRTHPHIIHGLDTIAAHIHAFWGSKVLFYHIS